MTGVRSRAYVTILIVNIAAFDRKRAPPALDESMQPLPRFAGPEHANRHEHPARVFIGNRPIALAGK